MRCPQTIVTTSWDDGHSDDALVAELLSEFGLQGTFYIAPLNQERPAIGTGLVRELGQDFEIGAHSATHVPLTGLRNDELGREIERGKSMLEDILGVEVPMFCYPRGLCNRRVRRAVMEAGFRGARTITEFYLDAGSDPWMIPTTLQAYPHPLWMRLVHGAKTFNWKGLANLVGVGAGKAWVELAHAFFERALESGGVWHLWGHSWEIQEQGLWNDLRAVLAGVAHRPGVRYLTNGQLVSCVEGDGSPATHPESTPGAEDTPAGHDLRTQTETPSAAKGHQ